jgi:hypothetical protein
MLNVCRLLAVKLASISKNSSRIPPNLCTSEQEPDRLSTNQVIQDLMRSCRSARGTQAGTERDALTMAFRLFCMCLSHSTSNCESYPLLPMFRLRCPLVYMRVAMPAGIQGSKGKICQIGVRDTDALTFDQP